MNHPRVAELNGREARPEGERVAMPAEWEPHEATWLAYPHNRSDWPGKLTSARAHGELVRRVAEGERVELLVNDAAHERSARRLLQPVAVRDGAVRFRRIPTNRSWMRDSGPLFVRRIPRSSGSQAAAADLDVLHVRFNGWAKYVDHERDEKVSQRVARALKLPLLDARVDRHRWVLEGGSAGSLLTTEECLLHPTIQTRNPGLTRPEWERQFAVHLGATNTIWLGRGIAGDDTTGTSTISPDSCRHEPSSLAGNRARTTKTTPRSKRTGSG